MNSMYPGRQIFGEDGPVRIGQSIGLSADHMRSPLIPRVGNTDSLHKCVETLEELIRAVNGQIEELTENVSDGSMNAEVAELQEQLSELVRDRNEAKKQLESKL